MKRQKKIRGEQRRPVTRCLGQICPDRVYTVEGLIRYAGIGYGMLRAARSSGTVRPITIGRRSYYLGRQVVEWIESQAAPSANRGAEGEGKQFSFQGEGGLDDEVADYQ